MLQLEQENLIIRGCKCFRIFVLRYLPICGTVMREWNSLNHVQDKNTLAEVI